MSHFDSFPEFEKEKKKLAKKYRSIPDDLKDFEEILLNVPTGIGKNFTIIHSEDNLQVVKARLACRSLRDRSLRVIYAYHEKQITFMYIELYFKGNKENEDRERVQQYIESMKD